MKAFLKYSAVSVLFLIASNSIVASLSPGAPKYHYEPHVSNLNGRVERRVYPGPPNYESLDQGDRVEQIWLVSIASPISIEGEGDPASINETEKDVKEIQLILPERTENLFKSHLGQMVILSGTLFHAHTGHHHLNILMDVRTYKFEK